MKFQPNSAIGVLVIILLVLAIVFLAQRVF